MEFNYQALCKMIYHDFLKIVKARGITKIEFIRLTETDDTNGSCYYKGTKIPSIFLTHKMSLQCGIPFSEVCPYYAQLLVHTNNAETQQETQLTPEENQLTPKENRLTLKENHLTPEEIELTPEENRLTLEENHFTPKETHLTPKENRLTRQENRLTLKETHLIREENHLTPKENSFINK